MIKRIKNWLDYETPEAMSVDEWVEFDKKFKENAPIRYFLMKSGPQWAVWYSIRRVTLDLLYGIRYFFTRPNLIRTGLGNSYHDKSELLFHGCFNLLVDYVEQECAWMHIVFDNELYKERLPFWRRFVPRIFRPRYRNVKDGLAHLQWESELGDESPSDQTEYAKEYMELYTWYKETRPNRKEPEYPISERDRSEHFLTTLTDKWKEENPEDSKKLDEYFDEYKRLKTKWHEEDAEMLVRLVKVKDGLWT